MNESLPVGESSSDEGDEEEKEEEMEEKEEKKIEEKEELISSCWGRQQLANITNIVILYL